MKSRIVKIFLFSIPVVLIGIFAAFSLTNKLHLLAYIPYQHVLGVRTTTTNSPHALMYGVSVHMSQLLPTSERYVTNSAGEDLIDIAAKLGINTFRITNTTPPTKERIDAIYTKNEWDMVLNKMEQKGIQAIILIESPLIYQKDIKSDYLQLVQKYILDSNVLSHPNVYAIDLKNEPIINVENNLNMIKQASQMIKSKFPHTRLTIGWWGTDTFKKDQDGNLIYKWDDYRAGRRLSNFIDFYSIHMYGFDRSFLGFYPDPYVYTKNFISDVKNGLQTKKSILIEEFGAANGEAVSDQDALGSAELQANTYAGVYQAIIDAKDPQLLGTTAYQYNSRYEFNDAWAIIKDDGDYLFPAAYVLQKYATGKSDISLTLPFTDLPNDYLLTNADNGSTKIINVKDIVGLKLVFDPSQTYTLTTSGDNTLVTTQSFTNYWIQNKYYATFHATSVGTTTIMVKRENVTMFQVNIIVK